MEPRPTSAGSESITVSTSDSSPRKCQETRESTDRTLEIRLWMIASFAPLEDEHEQHGGVDGRSAS
jgi:hypothetical protein